MKVVIANAVLAGLVIADRLTELNLNEDTVLRDAIGNLASELASVMTGAELVDAGVGTLINVLERGDTESALTGLTLLKVCTAEMVSEQERIIEAMFKNMSPEEAAIMQLMSMMQAMGVR